MARIGDIYSINTSKGLAYFQYTHKHSLMGTLIRVLPGIYPGGTENLEELVNRPTNFWVFFPVEVARRRGVVERVCHSEVPSHSSEMPLFRSGSVNQSSGKVDVWWLWDGSGVRKVGKISPEQRKLPIKGVWNDTLLIERIEEEWLPEKDCR